MFHLIRTSALIFRQMPGAMEEDYSWLVEKDPNHPFINASVNQLSLEIFNIRQETERLARAPRTPKIIEELQKLLRKARTLLAEMKKLPTPPNAQWSDGENDISDATSPLTTYPGPLYEFVGLHAALMYQVSWLSRLLLSTNVFRMMAAIHGLDKYKTEEGYDETASIATHCVNELVSSTPYFLGWKGKDSFKMTSSPCGTGTDDNPMRGGIGSLVQWPIFAASVSDFATEGQRVFLRGRLQYLADVVLIRQRSAQLNRLHHLAFMGSTLSRFCN